MAQGQNTSSILDFIGQAINAYATQSTKPGFSKTEFWLSLAVGAAGFIPTLAGPYGPIISAVVAVAYTALRTFVTVKAGTTAAAIASTVSTTPAQQVMHPSAGGGVVQDVRPGRM
jgi:hypothetical protein